eukprot:1037572-Prorocentrum_minimum.AAC.1
MCANVANRRVRGASHSHLGVLHFVGQEEPDHVLPRADGAVVSRMALELLPRPPPRPPRGPRLARQ